VTTCLSLVVFTTIIFGSTVGFLAYCLDKPPADEDSDSDSESEIETERYQKHTILHPNMIETPREGQA